MAAPGVPARVDPRILRSRATIIAAVLDLVDEVPLAELTLVAVAARAGVSRVTVYERFGSLDELLVAAMETSVAQVTSTAAAIEVAGDVAEDRPPADLVAVFRVLGEHAGLYRAMLGDDGSIRFQRRLHEALSTAVRESLRRLPDGVEGWRVRSGTYVDFVAGAVLSVAMGWLQESGGRDADAIALECWLLLRLRPEELAGRTP